jgi:hypothetical protein
MFGFPVVLLLALAAVAGGFGRTVAAVVRDNWMLLVPALAALGLYMLGTDLRKTSFEGQMSTRYVAAPAGLVVLAVLSAFRVRERWRSRLVFAVVGLAALFLAVRVIGAVVSSDLEAMARLPEDRVQLDVATAMPSLGIGPGAAVAAIGYKRNFVYWARIARVKIIAQVPDDRDFFGATSDVQTAVLQALATTGAKVAVYRTRSTGEPPSGWQPVGDTGYAVFPLTRLPSFRAIRRTPAQAAQSISGQK